MQHCWLAWKCCFAFTGCARRVIYSLTNKLQFANKQIRPQDYLEPVQILSVRAERTVTNNELSSVEVSNALPSRSSRSHLNRARVTSLNSCGWFEIAILNMSVLVILLSASSLMMMILILAGAVSTDRSAPTPTPIATTG